MSLFDLSNGVLDEDAAIQYTNPGDSVSKIGFFGPNEEFLYSITHMETFCLYTAADLSVISSYGDVRNEQTGIDYVVDCAYVPESQRLFLLSGTRDGAVNISNVNIDSIELIYAMSGGHSDIVRGMKYQVMREIECEYTSMFSPPFV